MSLKKRIDDDNQGRSNRQILTSEQISYWAYVGMIIIMLILLATACLPNRKFAKAVKTMNEDPEQAAWYCAVKFPVKDTIIYRDSISYDTIYDTNYFVDTTTIHDTTTITKTSPTKTIVKTVYQVKEIVRENTAKVTALEYSLSASTKLILDKEEEIKNCEQNASKWKGLAKQRFWWLLLLISAAAGWILRKPLMKLIKPI